MSRRLFLGVTASAGTSLLLGKNAKAEETAVARTINDILRALNDKKIPGLIQGGELILDDNAHHGLLVIEQIHWDATANKESLQDIALCQSQIKTALLSLIDDPDLYLRDVYQEGSIDRRTPRLFSEPMVLEKELEENRPTARYSPKETTEWKASLRPVNDASPLIRWGAADMLREEKKIRALPGEWEDAYVISGYAQDEEWKDMEYYLKTLRERALLEIIAASSRQIGVTVYGEGHNWTIADDWNEEQPKHRFSRLILKPEFFAPEIIVPPPPVQQKIDTLPRSQPQPQRRRRRRRLVV